MDWLEKLKQELKNTEIINKPIEKKLFEENTGYYTLPCAKEPYEGQVLKLTGDEFYLLFQRYSETTEQGFRDKLDRIDSWFIDKPYRVQENCLSYLPKWLIKGGN